MGKPGSSQRKVLGRKPKGVNKYKQPLNWTLKRIETRIARDQAKAEYLEERGFRNRQLRAWGETNAEFRRYHWCLVGNRPEMMPLDCHLFFDLADNTDNNIALTSSLDLGPTDDPCKYGRYGAGTPTHLSHSLRLTWADYPSPERIVEDIQRLPITIEQIIAHKGCLVPEAAIHKKGCSRTKRKGQRGVHMSSAVSKVVHQRHSELRAKAEKLAVGL
jgi:hypothetical protein